MENAVDALKLAFGIFVFLLGLAILFNMTSLAKETSRILISETDQTEYYEYKDSDQLMTVDGNPIIDSNRTSHSRIK